MSQTATPLQHKSLATMRAEVRETNEANGWFEEDRTVGDEVALLHSEVSEILEAYREHGMASWDCEVTSTDASTGHTVAYRKPEGVASEAADVLIRLLDFCERHDIDLEYEFERKMRCNRQRGHRHGGKRL